MKNLTNRYDIKNALEKELGVGAVSKYAKLAKCTPASISQHMCEDRARESTLRGMATFLGCRVHGVFPDQAKSLP